MEINAIFYIKNHYIWNSYVTILINCPWPLPFPVTVFTVLEKRGVLWPREGCEGFGGACVCSITICVYLSAFSEISFILGQVMGPKKRAKKAGPTTPVRCSPSQTLAKAVQRKYKSQRMSPYKKSQVRKALYSVSEGSMSIRKACNEYGLSYGFLHRRLSGEVEIDKLKGRRTIFTEAEETNMALWLSEMAQRGMGLRPCEFLDFVQEIVKKEKRETPFKDGRPGYDWYTSFKNRNSDIIRTRTETPLELKRSKITKDVTDKWYNSFRDFLMNIDCLDRPSRIWNCDETGFNMGCKSAKVVGPSRKECPVPLITHGKQRLTVMYCGNASGAMMPPFFVYPSPKPRSYNPLNGAVEGSAIAYTKKGWMDSETFDKFIDHFDKFAGPERPVVLLLDSVSSHVSHTVFMNAKSKGIELYRIVPNATHIMQPLDKGVFGPLKSKWHMVARKYGREHPGRSINKEVFAEKLNEAFLQFYKPLTVINAFKAAGIYPVDSSVVSSDNLKPAKTFSTSESIEQQTPFRTPCIVPDAITSKHDHAKGALSVFEETLTTPVKTKYQTRIQEGYDVVDQSPCFAVYKKLYNMVNSDGTQPEPGDRSSCSPASALDLLAEAASKVSQNVSETGVRDTHSPPQPLTASEVVSPVLSESLVFPKASEVLKPLRKTLFTTLPDNLTSSESIRTMSLKQLDKIKAFAEKEKKAREVYFKKINDPKIKKSATGAQRKGTSLANPKKGKGKKVNTVKQKESASCSKTTAKDFCKACLQTWEEDMASGDSNVWVQCDQCDGWMHMDCLAMPVDEDEPFICPDCD